MYDPEYPVPSFGGRFQASVPGGPLDQRLIEQRPDVLVYSTPPLEQPVEVTGPIKQAIYHDAAHPSAITLPIMPQPLAE